MMERVYEEYKKLSPIKREEYVSNTNATASEEKKKKSEETTGVLAITEDINSDDDSDNEEHNSHYWGQSLQYLERAVQIKGGKKIAVLAKREADIVRFSLKEGVGSWVGKPPGKLNGAVVPGERRTFKECITVNHVNDFNALAIKRLSADRKDMRMILARKGSLFLDPEALPGYHRLVALNCCTARQSFRPGQAWKR